MKMYLILKKKKKKQSKSRKEITVNYSDNK